MEEATDPTTKLDELLSTERKNRAKKVEVIEKQIEDLLSRVDDIEDETFIENAIVTVLWQGGLLRLPPKSLCTKTRIQIYRDGGSRIKRSIIDDKIRGLVSQRILAVDLKMKVTLGSDLRKCLQEIEKEFVS